LSVIALRFRAPLHPASVSISPASGRHQSSSIIIGHHQSALVSIQSASVITGHPAVIYPVVSVIARSSSGHRLSSVISSHQRSSAVISGHQRSSAVSGHRGHQSGLSGHQRSSAVIAWSSAVASGVIQSSPVIAVISSVESGHQRSSAVISGHQRSSAVIQRVSGHQLAGHHPGDQPFNGHHQSPSKCRSCRSSSELNVGHHPVIQ
jgi:hypothetical protein